MSDYLFYSNYPYFEALHLGRFIRWLAKIEFGLEAGRNPTQQLCHVAYHAGNTVFKNTLFDPGVSSEEFDRTQREEQRREKLTSKERERELEELAARLRHEDFDDDDGDWLRPVKERGRVLEFVSAGRLQFERLQDFASAGDSFVEDVACRYAACAGGRGALRGFYAIMTAWDPMRMQHEGRPPYSVSFAPSFFDSLEEVLIEEDDPQPDMARWVETLSEPKAYKMGPRDSALVRAGVKRARSSGVISAELAGELLKQMDRWGQ